jgi:hypothetical protein
MAIIVRNLSNIVIANITISESGAVSIGYSNAQNFTVMCSYSVATSGNSIPRNDTHTLVDSCDIMPYLSQATEQAMGNTVSCSSSTPPDCNAVTCNMESSNVVLTYTVLPCHDPPAIQIVNRDAHGDATFNKTFMNSTYLVDADILGWEHGALLNVTVVHHPGMLTMGVAVSYTV